MAEMTIEHAKLWRQAGEQAAREGNEKGSEVFNQRRGEIYRWLLQDAKSQVSVLAHRSA